MVRSIKNRQKARRKKNNNGSTRGEASSSAAAAAAAAGAVSVPTRVWQPGVDGLEDGEELQCDPSAYNSLHAFQEGWPCLSFDIVRDTLGLIRTDFPHTIYVVAGTQAEKATDNSVEIFKLSNISGKRRDLVPKNSGVGSDDEDSDDEDSDDDEDSSGAPLLQSRKVSHQGCVNRIRSMPQSPHICATWGDTGYMQIWDFTEHLNFLAESDTKASAGAGIFNQAPVSIFKHKDEGYAIDWNPRVPGNLVTGDCKNNIYLWEYTSGKWIVDEKNPFVGHSASVEDLQWSPKESNVFASASVDKTIAIWDARTRKPCESFKAHDADVNVISWNRLVDFMLASGSDDGSFTIHDLRMLKKKVGDPVVPVDPASLVLAHFTYHKHPITSIEWSPHEASTLSVSSADNQLTIWDLSLERDAEEEAEFKAQMAENVNAPNDLPPQLLFVHQGQKHIKELHWHAQIPGMIVSTAADGFNVLMPSNVESSLPASIA